MARKTQGSSFTAKTEHLARVLSALDERNSILRHLQRWRAKYPEEQFGDSPVAYNFRFILDRLTDEIERGWHLEVEQRQTKETY